MDINSSGIVYVKLEMYEMVEASISMATQIGGMVMEFPSARF